MRPLRKGRPSRRLRKANSVKRPERELSEFASAFEAYVAARLARAEIRTDAEEDADDDTLAAALLAAGLAIASRAARNVARALGVLTSNESSLQFALHLARTGANLAAQQEAADWAAHARAIVSDGLHKLRVARDAEARDAAVAAAKSRARLSARNRASQFFTKATAVAAKAYGIDSYIWTTQGDGLVREDHAALEGQRFLWSDPPVTNARGDRNHPGEDYNCRCEPYLDPADISL